MARIAVDMDEVVADALGEHIKRYNARFAGNIERAHLVGCHLHDVVPREHRRAAHEIVHCETFFEDLEVMPGAQEVLERLSREHEIFIATAAMEVPNSFASKYRWLQRHFPFISPLNYVFCGDKHIINADYLIDDSARHFWLFAGEGILFEAPHNKHVTGYRRVHNWFEVEQLFAAVPV
jgi:5'-nucleotidase